MLTLTPDLYWLTLVIVLTALLWLPYILYLIAQMGLGAALWDPDGTHPLQAEWAQRSRRAHANAVENLVVFAPLTILVSALGLNDGLTAGAAMVYFWVRLGHAGVYTLGLPVVRTLLFAAGVACQLLMAGRILDLL